jgi:hypothetical protein
MTQDCRPDAVQFAVIQPFLLPLYKCGIPGLFSRPHRTTRLVLVISINAVMWPLMIWGVATAPPDTGTFFLAALILLLSIYSSFYVVCKRVHREKILWLPTICAVLALALWGFALYYFTRGLTNWAFDAAVSREGNKDCIFLDFFDSHDAWHLLSAGALFFSCVGLLTLDDDIVHTKRSEIAVF